MAFLVLVAYFGTGGISGTSAIGIPGGYPLFGVAVTIWYLGVDNPIGGDFGDVCGSLDWRGSFCSDQSG